MFQFQFLFPTNRNRMSTYVCLFHNNLTIVSFSLTMFQFHFLFATNRNRMSTCCISEIDCSLETFEELHRSNITLGKAVAFKFEIQDKFEKLN